MTVSKITCWIKGKEKKVYGFSSADEAVQTFFNLFRDAQYLETKKGWLLEVVDKYDEYFRLKKPSKIMPSGYETVGYVYLQIN